MSNAVAWFEIPAKNFERAVEFYRSVLDAELSLTENRDIKMAFFPTEKNGIGRCIAFGEGYKPSANGTLAYLNGDADFSALLSRVEDAGGKVLMPKTKVSDEVGYVAIFRDTEGNQVAFHSQK